ncbi:ABC transporter substrate-binding protein [Chloroflexota bacterium]
MKKTPFKIIFMSVILLSGLLLSACSQPVEPTAANFTIVDGLGKTITLAGSAKQIISLAPSNTEILFAVGAGPQVVGRDAFSDYPAEAAEVVDIGGGFGELNLEVIIAANPDLVLAADLTPPEQIQTLEEAGLTVFALQNPTNFDGLYENIKTVAQLTGHEDDGAELVKALKARVSAVTEKAGTLSDQPIVFYELDSTDSNAPWTSGPGTFIDTLITMAGGINLGAKLEGAWVQISIEELITQDPDLIILGDFTWGGVTPEMAASRAGWEGLSAIQQDKVFTFDDNLVSRPGPRLVDGLEMMAKLLHPDIFK